MALNFPRDRQRLAGQRVGIGLGEGFRESALPACVGAIDTGGRADRGLVDVVDLQGVADVLLQRGHDVAAGEAGGGFLDLVKALLEVGHFGLAHGFLELALEFGGHLARLAHPLPDHAQHARQFFRADGDQRDDRDDDQFTPPDVEHEKFRSREALGTPASFQPVLPQSCRKINVGREFAATVPQDFSDQTALLPTSDRAAVDARAL